MDCFQFPPSSLDSSHETCPFSPFFQHDPENNKACVPGGEDGNYIMYARATSGDKKNNRQFSPCSLKSVREVSC